MNPLKVTAAINQSENSEFKTAGLLKGVNPQETLVHVRTGIRRALATELLGLAHLQPESPLIWPFNLA